MESPIVDPPRRTRADAVRNRERLIEAAAHVFGKSGAPATLETVAREAGVGIGTLYRHFPKREALFEAVYRREVDQLGDMADQLAAQEADPVEALRRWLHANVRLASTKRGMVEALQLAAVASDLKVYSFERLTKALALLLSRGVEAGQLRADISPEDLLRAMIGAFYADGRGHWQAAALRIVDLFVDGMTERSTDRVPDEQRPFANT